MSTLILENCAIATMDSQRAEHASGYVVVAGARIAAVGPGPAPSRAGEGGDTVRRIDAAGCLVTPGLVNTHHHLYQWATRGLAADATRRCSSG
jgi:cytosine/adenosine deaminase-related metal-dependent hydrolase